MNSCCKQVEDNARRQLEIIFDEKEAVLMRNTELMQKLAKAEELLRKAAYSIGDRAFPDSHDHLLFSEIDLFLEDDDD